MPGLAAVMPGVLPGSGETGKVKHSLLGVFQQRVFGIGSGREDANEAERLRRDASHLWLLERSPGVASEPPRHQTEDEHLSSRTPASGQLAGTTSQDEQHLGT